MYLWIKALHVVAIISWMAGLLYLPRLFVYHVEAKKGSVQSETFKIMENRLLYAIMTPAMLVAWGSGLYLAYEAGYFYAKWFLFKFILAIIVTIFHVYLARISDLFNRDLNIRGEKFYRILNEIPTILMLIIVSLVIVKP